ncbi:MAG TPA: hypothetical protein VK915_11685 [Gaiellaceae bacterium]|nr:hypothetical protein [Gaiellaceae bacterium]
MQKLRLLLACAVVLFATVPLTASAVPPAAAEATASFEYSQNMHPLGFSPREIPLANAEPGAGSFNSDLAFWGNTAVQGTYAGFRLIDVSAPAQPREIINWEECNSRNNTQGNQGDIVIWGDILVRSWNSPAPSGGSMCGDMPVAPGEEGVHIIDISDPTNPDVIAFVDLPCGSHTDTGVPDLANDRLILYSNPSGGVCPWIDIVEVPLSDPANPVYHGPLLGGRPCHDTGVILGDAMHMGCAGGNGFTLWTIDPADGASLTSPIQTASVSIPGVTIGHTAAWTWDGEIFVFGHEPGGGGQAQCQATSSLVNRTLFFFDNDGNQVGSFVQPRPQTATENCTWHNLNTVPTDKGYVLVSGNYQMGITVVDFTDPANAFQLAYADPAPLVNPDNPAGIELGGDWSTYWYNGRIYESDITRGMMIWKLSDSAVAGAKKLPHLNPQTQEITIDLK